MLDALRHHKAAPPDRDDPPGPNAPRHGVPAPLAQAFGQRPADERPATGKRLALALVLVSVTALLVWQVAAMNGLLPAGPLSRIISPIAAVRSERAPAPQPPITRGAPPAATETSAEPEPPAAQPIPAAANAPKPTAPREEAPATSPANTGRQSPPP
jgi:hypothetical protein